MIQYSMCMNNMNITAACKVCFCACPVEECLAMRCHRQAPEAVPPGLGSQQPTSAIVGIQISHQSMQISFGANSELEKKRKIRQKHDALQSAHFTSTTNPFLQCCAGHQENGLATGPFDHKSSGFFQHSQDSIRFTTLVN